MTTTTVTHCLYRLFDAAGDLLYVGITSGDPTKRFAHHRHNQPWWPEVASYTVESCATGDDAAASEARAIEVEEPRYNVRKGSAVDVRVFRTPGVGRQPMVMRSIRVPLKLWTAAKARADEREENISDVIREALERYVEGKR